MLKMIFIFSFLSYTYNSAESFQKSPLTISSVKEDRVGSPGAVLEYAPLTATEVLALKKASPSPGESKKDTDLNSQKKPLISQTQAPQVLSAKDYLIEKLEYLQSSLPKNHKARRPLDLRLAHILSLRAEDNFIKAEKENCGPCEKTAQASVRRSLAIYQKMDSLLLASHPLLHTEVLFKRAYLQGLLGDKMKSLNQLKRIVEKREMDPLLSTRAWFNIGEIYFELYDYEKSLQAFVEVLKQEQSPWRFKAIYRKIWSLSNLSFYDKSIDELESFLKSDLYSDPYLNREERHLKQKLENELMALYGYARITDQRLAFLYNFFKQDQKKNTLSERNKRLFNLAQTLNQRGRMEASNTVWKAYLLKSPSLKNQLSAYSFMIDNDLNLSPAHLLEDTGPKVEKVFTLRDKVQMSGDFQNDLKKKTKRFFDQIQAKGPFSKSQKEYLFVLYQKYNLIQPKDFHVLSRSGALAGDLKKYALAQDFFQRAALSLDSYTSKDIAKEDIKENMSLLQMEMAELAKDESRRLNSYDFYIQHGNREDLIFKAKYQKAYVSYENKKYAQSALSFKNLALYKSQKDDIKDLRLKAAHLSLSSIDRQGHQEEELVRRAGLFIKEFPKNRKEFMKIRHSALLNTVQKLVSNIDFSQGPVQASLDPHIRQAWSTLNQLSLKEATAEEAFSYHFNRLLLAKELLKFEEMNQSIQALLTDKKIKRKDREVVLTWQLWLAELRFDFGEVLRVIKILKPQDQSEDHLLRLARLSELAGRSPIPYYQIFVEKFPDSPSLIAVVADIVEKSLSKNKKTFLQKYSSLFKSQPDTLTLLILKGDGGQWDERFMKPFARIPFMKNSPLVSFLQRKEQIESFEKAIAQIAGYSLPQKLSGSRLIRALKNYSGKMDQFGQSAETALKTQDWVARVFIVSHWKKETARFYRAIMELPLPKGLTEEERRQYISLLEERLQPYKKQLTQLQKELDSLWMRDFVRDYRISLKQDTVFYAPLKWEMEKLSTVSYGDNKKQIQFLLSSLKTQAPPEIIAEQKDSQVQNLYELLKRDPFDQQSLMKLLDLEKRRKNKTLSYYLVNRIKELKKRKRGIRL